VIYIPERPDEKGRDRGYLGNNILSGGRWSNFYHLFFF